MIEFSFLEIILFLLGNAFRLYIVHCFLSIFCENYDHTIVRRILYIFAFLLNNIGNLYIGWPPLINVISNIIGVGVISITYNGTIRNKIFYVLAIIALNIACEDGVFYILVKINVTWTVILGLLVSNLIAYLLVQILKRIVEHKKGENVFVKEWGMIVCIPICSIFMSVVVLDNCVSEPIIAAGCIALSLINLLVFYLFERLHKMYHMKLDVLLLEQQNKALENEISIITLTDDKIKRIHHDINNHFFVLEHLAKKDNSEGVVSYIQNLNNSFDSSYKYVNTGNALFDGFINMKLAEAEKCGAKILTDIKVSNNIRIKEKDISILIGNILDNAIDALKNCISSKMIRIIIKEEPGIIALKVENTYNGKIYKEGKSFLSTKENVYMHGIGLKNIRSVIEEYNGSLSVDYDDNIFLLKAVLFTER